MGRPISVLQVEDNEDDALLILLSLRRSGYDVVSERVDTPAALQEALTRRDWDIVLSDFAMPAFNGLEALQVTHRVGKPIPFLVVSGAIGEETAVELMRNGAQDCIMKDKLSRLPPAVKRELGEAQMRQEREEALESLRRELKLNATLAELSKNLIALPEDLSAVAALVLRYAEELTDSRDGFVAVVDAVNGSMTPLTFTEIAGGLGARKVGGQTPEFRRAPDGTWGGLWGHALNTKLAFFENQPTQSVLARGLPDGHIPVSQFLAAPVLSGETLLGLIAIANPGRDYTAHDLTAVGRLADLFSIAIANHQNLLEREQLSARLRHVQKIEAIGTLAGGIAHDFNNILTPMMGYADMVKTCLPKDTKVWRQQENVLAACSRAKELVQQILALSRETEEERQPTLIHVIVKEALRLLRSSIPSTIEIRQNVDAACGPVLAVPTQIHQVVMNLCTNAYHAMREGGGVLHVAVTQVRIDALDERVGILPGDYARLEVTDTGCGMDRKTQEKVFDPYFTTKKTGEGTGLGLSVVESIVRKHGGHITVQSETGVGSTFCVYLPLVQDEVSTGAPQKDRAPARTGEERILIVDDVSEIVDMAKEMLETLGYQVTGYSASPDALAAFREDPSKFDLVITDLTMPTLTGVELARLLLQIREDIPIILCSGLNERTGTEAVGIRKYLQKPVSFRDYSEAVRQVLDAAKGNIGAARATPPAHGTTHPATPTDGLAARGQSKSTP